MRIRAEEKNINAHGKKQNGRVSVISTMGRSVQAGLLFYCFKTYDSERIEEGSLRNGYDKIILKKEVLSGHILPEKRQAGEVLFGNTHSVADGPFNMNHRKPG